MLLAVLLREVEAELRRLDRDLDVELPGVDLVEHAEVVLRDLLRLFRVREVLAEARQDGAVAQGLRGVERGLGVLARHELLDGGADEPDVRRPLAQEAAVGRREERRFA